MTGEPSLHRCRYRDDNHGYWNAIRNWWLLPAHFVAALVFVLVLELAIDGKYFTLSSAERTCGMLYQSGIVTMVSISLVIVRSLAAAWLSLAGCRMGFIVMEKGGATLNQLDRLISFKIPMFRRHKPRTGPARHSRGFTNLHLLALWATFSFAVP